MLENICIILVETSHTENIGLTSRVIKAIELILYLVNTLILLDSKVITLSAGANDVILLVKQLSSRH